MTTSIQEPLTFQSSELSRNSKKVFAAAEDQPILVTRRDGESLVLMSERQAEAREKLLEFAAQLIAVTLDERGTLSERMSQHFPWMLALEEPSREQCANDLIAAARASFSMNQEHLIATELNSWRETAVALAAGLGQEKVEWLDEELVVERP